MSSCSLICEICTSESTNGTTYDLMGAITSVGFVCEKCQHFSRIPLPSDEFLNKYYARRYFRYPKAIEKFIAQRQASVIHNYIKKNGVDLASVTFIEIGGGRGWLSAEMNALGVGRTMCVEPDRSAREWGEQNLRVDYFNSITDSISCAVKREACEVIFVAASHVLEHVSSPAELIGQFSSSEKNLMYYFEVPNGELEQTLLLVDHLPEFSSHEHLRSFSTQSIRIFMESLKIKECEITVQGNPHYWRNRIFTLRFILNLEEAVANWRSNNVRPKEILKWFVLQTFFVVKSLTLILIGRIFYFGRFNRRYMPAIVALGKSFER